VKPCRKQGPLSCTQLGHPAAPASDRASTPSLLLLLYLQEGKPSKRQAAAAREAPEHKAMPTRFYTVLLLLFWQAQLMAALTQLK
jgi:hypothetical protein